MLVKVRKVLITLVEMTLFFPIKVGKILKNIKYPYKNTNNYYEAQHLSL